MSDLASWTSTADSDKKLALQWQNTWSGTTTASLGTGCVLSLTTSTATLPVTLWRVTGSVAVANEKAPTPPQRQPAPLAFSPTINATELVLEFLAEARERIPGLTREGFLRLTIADFFAFLLRRAAEADGVAAPANLSAGLGIAAPRLRCGGCGRFLPQAYDRLRLYHCGVPCLNRAAERQKCGTGVWSFSPHDGEARAKIAEKGELQHA